MHSYRSPPPSPKPPRHLALLVLLLVAACGGGMGTRHAVGAGSLVDRYIPIAGTAGTVTVPTGTYLLQCSALATASGATITVTPCGPSIGTCTAGAAWAVPTTNVLTFTPPGAPNSVADTSTVVFSGTSSYACAEWQYKP